MIIGSPDRFAIESTITQAFEQPSQLALGYFILHVAGQAYGVRAEDATLLACSFDEVRDRVVRRGAHSAPGIQTLDATSIADRFIRSYLRGEIDGDETFGEPQLQVLFQSHVKWAPDGDEAFDDGSYVFQFDIDDQTRLVAFRNEEHGVEDVSEIWLPADEFYSILSRWLAAFEDEWRRRDKKASMAGVTMFSVGESER